MPDAGRGFPAPRRAAGGAREIDLNGAARETQSPPVEERIRKARACAAYVGPRRRDMLREQGALGRRAVMTSPEAGESGTIDDCERSFHLEEYKMVWRRLEASFEQFQKMPVLAALGSTGIFAWLAVGPAAPGYRDLAAVAWMLPFALTIFLMFASRAHYRMIKLFSAYSMRLEKRLGSAELGGWSRYFNDDAVVPKPGSSRGRMQFYDGSFGEPWSAGTRGLALWFFLPLLMLDLVIGAIGACLTLV
jgi:hypothetical protein